MRAIHTILRQGGDQFKSKPLVRSWCREAHNRRAIRGMMVQALFVLALVGWDLPASPGAPRQEPAGASPPRVWPAPPAEPRITYVRSIAGPADLGFRPSGWNRLANLVTGGNKGKEKLAKPFGVALDESDNLCVTDTGTGQVWYFDLARKRMQIWERVGSYTFPSPVAIAKRKGRIYVADSVLQKVIVFDERGTLSVVVSQNLIRPAGLAVSDEKLFVADTATHQIAVFSLNGQFLGQFGKRGEAPGEFNFPTHLTLDTGGSLWVTDSMNARILKFDPAGQFQNQIGRAGDSSGHLSRPKGVAVDCSGHIYVVDALFDNFQIFNSQGDFLLAVGAAGSGAGEFWLPAGIAISRDQKIYVADGYNGRIQVFQYLGKP